MPEEQLWEINKMTGDLYHNSPVMGIQRPLMLFFTSPSFSVFHPAFLKLSLKNQNAHISLEDLKPTQTVKKLLFQFYP